MSFFNKLFGNPAKRELKFKIQERQKDVEQQMGPLSDIVIAIIKASDHCSKEMKPFIHDTDEKRKQEKEAYVFYEFIYFFMHMMMRCAFDRLSEPQIKKLQSFAAPIIAGTAIDSFCFHRSEDLKKNMRSTFYKNLNDAEIEYSSSSELLSKDEPFTGDSLISKLSKNVTQLISDDTNPAKMTVVSVVSTRALIDAKLDQLISTAAPALDWFTNEDLGALTEYWDWQQQ